MEVGINLKGCIRQRKNLSRRKGTPVSNISSIWFHVKSPHYMSSFNFLSKLRVWWSWGANSKSCVHALHVGGSGLILGTTWSPNIAGSDLRALHNSPVDVSSQLSKQMESTNIKEEIHSQTFYIVFISHQRLNF